MEPGFLGQFADSFQAGAFGVLQSMTAGYRALVAHGDPDAAELVRGLEANVGRMLADHPEWQMPESRQEDKNPFSNPTLYAHYAGSALPAMLAALGAALLGGPLGALYAIGLAEAGQTYREAERAGAPRRHALLAAATVGAANAAIERLPLGRLLGVVPGGAAARQTIARLLSGNLRAEAGRAAAGALREGAEETLQQLVANAVAATYDQARGLVDGAVESFLVGATLPAMRGTVTLPAAAARTAVQAAMQRGTAPPAAEAPAPIAEAAVPAMTVEPPVEPSPAESWPAEVPAGAELGPPSAEAGTAEPGPAASPDGRLREAALDAAATDGTVAGAAALRDVLLHQLGRADDERLGNALLGRPPADHGPAGPPDAAAPGRAAALGALAEAGLALPPTPPSVDGVTLSPARQRRFREIVQERLAELATPLLERGALAALPAAGRARLLGRLRAGARDMAAAQLMVELQAGPSGRPAQQALLRMPTVDPSPVASRPAAARVTAGTRVEEGGPDPVGVGPLVPPPSPDGPRIVQADNPGRLASELQALAGDAGRIWADGATRYRAIADILQAWLTTDQTHPMPEHNDPTLKRAIERVDRAILAGLEALGLPRGPIRRGIPGVRMQEVLGIKLPSCALNISAPGVGRAISEGHADSVFGTWLHESLHARQPWASDRSEFAAKKKGYEEGLAEGLARMVVLERAGHGPMAVEYDYYVRAYRELARAARFEVEELWRRLWRYKPGEVRAAFVDEVARLHQDRTGTRLTTARKRSLRGSAEQVFDDANADKREDADMGAFLKTLEKMFR